MRMTTATTTIQRHGVHSESTFKIAASAKAFEILSSGLYKDPITAIVRELACNAWDAHVVAKKADIPFTIHLPTTFEPYFSVKDKGIGLSDEDIQGTPLGNGERKGGLYTTYFESTKTTSNDEIGAFGLGCKSPYSYAETFQVISCFEGVKRIYSMFLNEHRLPTVALLSEELTDEKNGLEVNLAVKNEDHHKFYAATASVLRFFKVKPNVIGVRHFSFEDVPEGTLEGDNWKIVGDLHDYYNNASFTAVMGQIPYRVDLQKLENHLPNGVLAFVKKLHIISMFNIGDLEIPPDREEVRYNDRTILALVNRITDIRKKFITEIEKRVDDIKKDCFWEKYIEINSISTELFRDSNVMCTFLRGATTNPTLLRYIQTVTDGGLYAPVKLTGHIITTMNNITGRSQIVKLETGESSHQLDLTQDNDKKDEEIKSNIRIVPNEKTIVFYNDVTTLEKKRVRVHLAHLRNQNIPWPSKIIIIDRLSKKKADKLEWPYKLNDKKQDTEFLKIQEAFGNPEVVYLSQVNAFAGTTRTRGKRSLSVYKYSARRGRKGRTVIDWQPGFLTDSVYDAGGPYVVLSTVGKKILDHNGNEVPNLDIFANLHAVIGLVNMIKKTSYKIEDVLGVSKLSYKQIKSEKKWINLFEVANSIIAQHDDIIKTFRSYVATENVFWIKTYIGDDSVERHYKQFKTQFDKLHRKSLFKEKLQPLVNAIDKLHTFGFKTAKDLNVFKHAILKDYTNGKALISNNIARELSDYYPMLSFVTRIEYHNENKIFEYINTLDRSKK